MLKFDVQMQLEDIRDKRQQWKDCYNTFNFNVNKVMRRLFHEAAVNYMSVEEVAKASGLKHSQVRREMRRAGLDPKQGKNLLMKTAAEALATNAELLGVHPSEVDLMSPLAYLPAGSELKQRITDASIHTVTELEDEVSGNLMDKNALADTIRATMIGHCGVGINEAIAQAVLDAGWHK